MACHQIQPFVRLNEIFWNALSLIVHEAKQVLTIRAALFGRTTAPICSFSVILRHASSPRTFAPTVNESLSTKILKTPDGFFKGTSTSRWPWLFATAGMLI